MTQAQKTRNDQTYAYLVIATVSLEFGIPHTDIYSAKKGTSQISFARQVSMYLLNIVFGINASRVGRVFRRDRSTASYACNMIEDQREDPILDEKLNRLENFLALAPLPDPH